MMIEQLKERLPDHARELRMNLGVITSSTMLTTQQAWGTALAAAVTSRNAEVVAGKFQVRVVRHGQHGDLFNVEAVRRVESVRGQLGQGHGRRVDLHA